MKKLTFITVALSVVFFSATAFSASTSVLTALFQSPIVKSIADIHKVEVVNTYRCRNCYDISVSGTSNNGPSTLLVHIEEKNYTNTFNIQLVNESFN